MPYIDPHGHRVHSMLASMLAALAPHRASRLSDRIGFDVVNSRIDQLDLSDRAVVGALLTIHDEYLRVAPADSFRRRLLDSYQFPWHELTDGLRREAEAILFLEASFETWLAAEPLNGLVQYTARVLHGANQDALAAALEESGWLGSWQAWLMSADVQTIREFVLDYASAPDVHHTISLLYATEFGH